MMYKSLSIFIVIFNVLLFHSFGQIQEKRNERIRYILCGPPSSAAVYSQYCYDLYINNKFIDVYCESSFVVCGNPTKRTNLSPDDINPDGTVKANHRSSGPNQPTRPVTTAENDPNDATPLNDPNKISVNVTPPDGKPGGKILNVTFAHNTMWKGQNGIMIYTDFEIYNSTNQSCRLFSYFYTSDGAHLDADRRKNDDEFNNLVAGDLFTPKSTGEKYTKFRGFLPYNGLRSSLDRKRIGTPATIKFHVSLQNTHLHTQLARSAEFTFTID